MSKDNKHSFSSVISVNPYNDTYIASTSSLLTQESKPEFSKEQYIISYLNTKSFLSNKIEISKNIPDEDLYDAINNKIYDELALDQAVSYQIQYIESFNDVSSENRVFQVFIVDPEKLDAIFHKSIEQIKYIDIAIPAPLLIKSLYTKEIIESSGVHCFVYFQENDAFIAVYNEKEFVYSKSIPFSFYDMYERFCELFGEKIEYEEFIEFLSKEDFKTSKSDFTKYYIRLYKEILSNISDIITYLKRAYEIDNIEKLYIGTQLDTVTKFDEIAEAELSLRTKDFIFECGYENSHKHLDQLHNLMQLYTTVSQEDRYECNFSIYHRPPSFIKRESGKLIILTLLFMVLAFAYPITYWSLNYVSNLRYNKLKKDRALLQIKKSTKESIIKDRLAERKRIISLLKDEQRTYKEKKDTLIKINDVKVNYKMKAKLLALLVKDLNKFNVKIQSVSYAQNEISKVFTLSLVAKRDEQITKLIEHMTDIHDGVFLISIDKIVYDKSKRRYFSELKVTTL